MARHSLAAAVVALVAALGAGRARGDAEQPPLPAPPEGEILAPEAPATRAAPPGEKLLPRRREERAQAQAPALPAWPGLVSTAGGALGGLALPTLAAPEQNRAQLAAALDWRRSGNFLFPDSTSQRTGWALAGSYGAAPWLE